MRSKNLNRNGGAWLCALPGLIIISALSSSLAEPPGGLRPAERLLQEKRPLVIAHRGYSTAAPENSLPAFQLAITAGSDLVELDYHHSKDGIPIVIHDYEVDRTTDGVQVWGGKKIRVDQKTAAELQTLDAGKWFDPQFAGVRLPLLTEALDLIQKQNVTLIERKAGDAATCVRILRERDLLNRVVVQSFDWTYLKDFRQLEPAQILGALGPPGSYAGKKLTDAEKRLQPKWNDEVKSIGAQLIVWNRNITPEAVRDAHSKGLKVWVYTIDEPAVANQLLDMEIDGIITNNPGLIWRTIALRAK
jgi:glycerophosphoryl diester phosphodiesterase